MSGIQLTLLALLAQQTIIHIHWHMYEEADCEAEWREIITDSDAHIWERHCGETREGGEAYSEAPRPYQIHTEGETEQ